MTEVGYRFPTVSELYQTVTNGPTIIVPNLNLVPENIFSAEVAAEIWKAMLAGDPARDLQQASLRPGAGPRYDTPDQSRG